MYIGIGLGCGKCAPGGEGPAFDPGSVVDEWFDPTDSGSITLSGSNVTAWSGQKAAYSMSQGTVSDQPTLDTKNGNQVIRLFGGTGDARWLNISPGFTGAYMALAYWGTDESFGDTTRAIIGGTASSDPFLPIGQDGSTNTEIMRNIGSPTITRDGSVLAPANRNEAHDQIMAVNGVFEFAGMSPASLGIVALGTGPFSFDAYGYVGDVFLCTATPDTATRASLRGYLATKWGL